MHQTRSKLLKLDSLYSKCFRIFEQNYNSWTSEDLLMWIKCINNLDFDFIVESYLTLANFIEENEITGQNVLNYFTSKKLENNKIFGYIQSHKRHQLIKEITKLSQRQNTTVPVWQCKSQESRIFGKFKNCVFLLLCLSRK